MLLVKNKLFLGGLFKIREVLFILSIHFVPRYSYLFSLKKRVIPPDQRLKKTPNFLDDFITANDPLSGKIVFEDKINIVMRGASVDLNKLNKMEGKTYLLNFSEIVNNKNVVYITGDQRDCLKMVNKGMNPIILVDGMDENGKALPDIRGIRKYVQNGRIKRILFRYKALMMDAVTSGHVVIAALCKHATDVSIYGWDWYQTKDLGEMSYWEALFSMKQFYYDGILGDPGSMRDRVDRAILTYHTASRISEVSWISNHGFLKNINKHKSLVTKLDKIVYK
jgi:hypothetical protein